MATIDRKMKRAELEHYRGDPWALLNATDDALTDIGDDDLRELLDALRALYILQATEPRRTPVKRRRIVKVTVRPEAQAGVMAQLAQIAERHRRVIEAFDKLRDIMDRTGLDGAGTMPAGALRELRDPLLWLVGFLGAAHAGNVYRCEHCGRIGPAERSDKRFCNADCRAAAHYAARRD